MHCKPLIMLTTTLLLTACATTPAPDQSMLAEVEAAIARAVHAGAEQSAPVELRFARERLAFVKNSAMPNEDYELANWRLQEAQLDAQLAYVKAQTSMARASEAQAKAEADRLRANIVDAYGTSALPGDMQ
jgi:lactam utilization protein B